MNKKIKIGVITEGAIYVAIYGLLSIIGRFLFTGSDSLIYYIYPLPISIYAARYNIVPALIASIASAAICFIYGNPIFVLIVVIPNIVAGLIFGSLYNKINLKILLYLIIYIMLLAADFSSVYSYEILGEVNLIEDTTKIISSILERFNISIPNLSDIIKLLCIMVIIIDAAVKTFLNILLFKILSSRLKLVEIKDQKKFVPKFNFLVTIGYLIICILTMLSSLYLMKSGTIFSEIIYIICGVILFIYSMYLVLQATIYFNIKRNRQGKMGITFLIVIICFILLPISVIFSLILNLIPFVLVK